LANLFDEVKKVAVSIRSVSWPTLIPIVEVFDCGVDALDRSLAEVEISSFGGRIFLQGAKEVISINSNSKFENRTHRGKED